VEVLVVEAQALAEMVVLEAAVIMLEQVALVIHLPFLLLKVMMAELVMLLQKILEVEAELAELV
tara:strand:+ start:194 stop:385 length:192 start_codon:yes stop_codon:yes gene_type:complete